MKLPLVLLACLYLTTACETLLTGAQYKESVPKIVINKGPCFGQCPVYTMTVYDNSWVKYEGERFTDKQGIHVKKLDRLRYEQLVQAFENAKLGQYQRVYPAQVPDLPTVRMIYYDDAGELQEVVGKDGRPEKVVELEELLDATATSGGWSAQDGSTNSATRSDGSAQRTANEVIVQLAGGVNPNVWVIPYDRQGLKLIERIAPNRDYYLFQFDPAAIQATDLLDLLRRNQEVLSAELNKGPVEYRY